MSGQLRQDRKTIHSLRANHPRVEFFYFWYIYLNGMYSRNSLGWDEAQIPNMSSHGIGHQCDVCFSRACWLRLLDPLNLAFHAMG